MEGDVYPLGKGRAVRGISKMACVLYVILIDFI